MCIRLRIVTMICAAILLLSAGIPGVQPSSALADAALAELYPYQLVSNASPFFYSDAMLMADANELSTDLAKASAALSADVYSYSTVVSTLTSGSMGYTISDKNVNYSTTYAARTALDCDHCAYVIGYKQVGDYIVYCVPIRGTIGAEWYSTLYHLGPDSEGYHEGFHKAAKEIYSDLINHINYDNYAADHTIVWLCGHSRGAAVANIIAGKLTASGAYAPSDQIFAYTFACPAVGKNTTGYSNIYNFNNNSDMVPKVPLRYWNYYRNGQDVPFDTSASNVPATDLTSLLVEFAGDEESYNDPKIQLALTAVSYAASAGEITKDDFAYLLGQIDVNIYDLAKNLVLGKLKDKLLEAVGLNPTVVDAMVAVARIMTEELEKKVSTYTEWQDFLDESIEYWDTHVYNAAMQKSYITNHQTTFDRIGAEVGFTVNDRNSMYNAKLILHDMIAPATELASAAARIKDHKDDYAQLPNNHNRNTYVAAVNDMYYGYRGKIGYSFVAADIPANITTIGPYCFQNCTTMTELNLHRNVHAVGENAFSGCSGLTEVTWPVELDTTKRFSACPLTTIHYIKGGNGVMAGRQTGSSSSAQYYEYTLERYGIRTLTHVDFEEGITAISDYAFYSFSGSSADSANPRIGKLTEVVLPSTLQSVGKYAFYGHLFLENISLPEGFTALGEFAFAYTGIPAITEVDTGSGLFLPSTVTQIPASCFRSCTALEKVTLRRTVTSLGEYVFYDCNKLDEITLPVEINTENRFQSNPITTIHYLLGGDGVMANRQTNSSSSAMYYTRMLERCVIRTLTHVDFEKGITSIGDYAFYGFSGSSADSDNPNIGKLTEVVLPSTLQSIGKYAFYAQTSLNDVPLPEGFTTLGEHAYGRTGITAIVTEPQEEPAFVLPESVTQIPASCFRECASLEKVTLRRTVTSLGQSAFYDCGSLNEITLPVEINTENRFQNNPIASIHYLKGGDGVMANRQTNSSSSAMYYTRMLERCVIRTLTH
ncbi:MAG: leucine-rich repeat protein, partial [Clostridia bacterium]|nr:leucine-rich repeat protein [Clostridia bacterium]